MDESEDNMSPDDIKVMEGPSLMKPKPKKRSLVERELETSLTARVTSPMSNGESTSRYGRTRRLKTDADYIDTDQGINIICSPTREATPVKIQSPVYKMHASNSPIKTEPNETPKKVISLESSLDSQIDNIYHENVSLSRFSSDEKSNSSGQKYPKVYVRKDLIQTREKEDYVMLIKNLFSPNTSAKKSYSHLNNILERSSEKYALNTSTENSKAQSEFLDNSSVVKTLDFDSNKKKKKENRNGNSVMSKSELFEMEAKCEYQVGDLVWARMGTYPFWPCIVTREPASGLFMKKKLFGRIERDIIHVTFFGDNGRRGWIVDTMLRRFLGQLEFEATRDSFTPAEKKKDPRLYAAFFVSDKRMPQWNTSVEEAETLLREPKRLRIDILYDMLEKSRCMKTTPKQHKSGKIARTTSDVASDVSLSESLYDTLFSEDDGKSDDTEKSRSKTRMSLDVSEVVTACLDNMAAKTGITKIQKQSHMDRWLQKAKSKTPEKAQANLPPPPKEKEVKVASAKRKKSFTPIIVPIQKPYSFRKSSYEPRILKSNDNEHDYTTKVNDTPQTLEGKLKQEDLKASEIVETNTKDQMSNITESEIKNEIDTDVSLQENTNNTMDIDVSDTNVEQTNDVQVNMSSVEENEVLLSNNTDKLTENTETVKEATDVSKTSEVDKLTEITKMDVDMSEDQIYDAKTIDNDSEKQVEIAQVPMHTLDTKVTAKTVKAGTIRTSRKKIVSNTDATEKKVVESTFPVEASKTSPQFVKYLELRQDAIMEEHPSLTQEEIEDYLFKTWQYEDLDKSDEIKSDSVKGQSSSNKKKKRNLSLNSNARKSKKIVEDTPKTKFLVSPSVRRSQRPRFSNFPADCIDPNDKSFFGESSKVLNTDIIHVATENSPVTIKQEIESPVLTADKYLLTTPNSSSTPSRKSLRTRVPPRSPAVSIDNNEILTKVCEDSRTENSIESSQSASELNVPNSVEISDKQGSELSDHKMAIKGEDKLTEQQQSSTPAKRRLRTRLSRSPAVPKDKNEINTRAPEEISTMNANKSLEDALDNIVSGNSIEITQNPDQPSVNLQTTPKVKMDIQIKEELHDDSQSNSTSLRRSHRRKFSKSLAVPRDTHQSMSSTSDKLSIDKAFDTVYNVTEQSVTEDGSAKTLNENGSDKQTVSEQKNVTEIQDHTPLVSDRKMDTQVESQSPISSNSTRTSVKRSLRTRLSKSPAVSVDKNNIMNSAIGESSSIKTNDDTCIVTEISKTDNSLEIEQKLVEHRIESTTVTEVTEVDAIQTTSVDQPLEMSIEENLPSDKKEQQEDKKLIEMSNEVAENPVEITQSTDDINVNIEQQEVQVIELRTDTEKPTEAIQIAEDSSICSEAMTDLQQSGIGKTDAIPTSADESLDVNTEQSEQVHVSDGTDKCTSTTSMKLSEMTEECVIDSKKITALKQIDSNDSKTTNEKDNEKTSRSKTEKKPSIGNDKQARMDNQPNENFQVLPEEDKEYGHLDFVFSFLDEKLITTASDMKKPVNGNMPNNFITCKSLEKSRIIGPFENTADTIASLKNGIEESVINTSTNKNEVSEAGESYKFKYKKLFDSCTELKVHVQRLPRRSLNHKIINVKELDKEILLGSVHQNGVENIVNVCETTTTANKDNCKDVYEKGPDKTTDNAIPNGETATHKEKKNHKYDKPTENTVFHGNPKSKKDIVEEELTNGVDTEGDGNDDNQMSIDESIGNNTTDENHSKAKHNVVTIVLTNEIDVHDYPNSDKDPTHETLYNKRPSTTSKEVPSNKPETWQVVATKNTLNTSAKELLISPAESGMKDIIDNIDAILNADSEPYKGKDDQKQNESHSISVEPAKVEINEKSHFQPIKSETIDFSQPKPSALSNVYEYIYDDDDEEEFESPAFSPIFKEPIEPKPDDTNETDVNKDSDALKKKDNDKTISKDTSADLTASKETVTSTQDKHLPIAENEIKKENYAEKDELMSSLSRLPEPVKMNGYHLDEYGLDFSDNDFNAETSSVNSEDSEPLSVTKTKLLSKNRKNAKKALNDGEFVKYLELRQDALMDEHPELNEDEIIDYLYKTWQYEEDAKSDIVKNDDIQQASIVKGLNDNLRQKSIRNRYRDTKKRNKKQDGDTLSISSTISKRSKKDDDTLSINSDISDVSTRRRLRTRYSKSPALSLDENEFPVSKESSPERKTEIEDSMSLDSEECVKMTRRKIRNQILDDSLEGDDNFFGSKAKAKSAGEEVKVEPDETRPTKSLEKKEKSPKRHIGDNKSPRSLKESRIEKYFSAVSSNVESKSNNIGEEDTLDVNKKIKEEFDPDTASIASVNSEDSEVSLSKRKQRRNVDKKSQKSMDDPEFLKYVELRQDELIDENPQLSQDEIMSYLFKTWLYEESVKSDLKKSDEIEQANLVKGLNTEVAPPRKVRKKIKVEKYLDEEEPKEKPKRKVSQPYYNEDTITDIEEEIELFEIFKANKKKIKAEAISEELKKSTEVKSDGTVVDEIVIPDEVDEVELYFSQLTQPKPNLFKGLVREKVCEICEKTGDLVKCKACCGMFHAECVKKEPEEETVTPATRGRKKKKRGRKPKNFEDSGSHSDEKSQDVSEEHNASTEDVEIEPRVVDEAVLEAALTAKMKEILPTIDLTYDSYSSDDGLDWESAQPGHCEIVDVKIKQKIVIDYSDFKCRNCQVFTTPVCFVCKNAVSKTGVDHRQKCQTNHCNKYYHLECLDHWPQTQFNSGEPSKNNKKISEHFEAVMCPRHVCHTCVSDDPRGCKTRFSGDKLARCVRCPATYHSFTKCLPAGTQILTGSLIVCPRHYEHRPGKVPCHVNTGWCFICALGGSLICCEYCPTSFHAECLNIKPPEGGYMCEDCETGRLPLYGEMVWVKLGHYRWWPGIVLHPSEIPENILAVKHSPGEFVVRFFGQYDHYWVNRGRVFPFQEGDSGRISTHKSKIDHAFITAMEHAHRAFEILKTAEPNDEQSLDIASSLLPPHYVKLKVNKPCGPLVGRRPDVEESSLTQCECDPLVEDPCGPYSHCLNRMLLTECGPICRAGDRCSNRAFEKRQYPKMVPYRTPHRGWGLKTLDNIRAGQFVIEYVGELIDEEEFRRRMNRMHEIRDENFYFLTLDKERMIDAGPKGNLARFMNHCCEPNCETQKWTVLGDVRVGLFALYDIPANSELTFNYNLECAGIEKKRCLCGAKRCSGYIGAKPKQDESQPKKKRAYKKRAKPAIESPSTSKNKPKRPVGRPAKPRELTDIEKDLLIIKNATNGILSDSECSRVSIDKQNPKALKRKRVSFSTEESSSPTMKKLKEDSSPTTKKLKEDTSPSTKRPNDDSSSPTTKKLLQEDTSPSTEKANEDIVGD